MEALTEKKELKKSEEKTATYSASDGGKERKDKTLGCRHGHMK